ncbi:hypothetical protein [Hymenobacter sp.]|uniref:hypothetical protein n=1 Tax=Hymenobacter sp. TaxID=1898978 RepID=UPI00286AABC0|nr:hypothetical protein [Hymenobacter sp.]
MNPSQPQPAEEQILLTVADQSKLDLVMELLSHFDLVRAERVRAQSSRTQNLTPEEKARRFLLTAGQWEGRTLDADELRERAARRGNSGS